LHRAGRGIPQNGDAAELRHRFLQQFQPLFAEFRKVEEYARHLAARSRKTVDETATYGIGFQIQGDDGGRGGRRFGSLNRGRTDCDDHIYFAFHQLYRRWGNLCGIAARRPKDQFDIVRLSVSGRLKPTPERREARRSRRGLNRRQGGCEAGIEDANFGRLGQLLRARRQRPRHRAVDRFDRTNAQGAFRYLIEAVDSMRPAAISGNRGANCRRRGAGGRSSPSSPDW